MPDPIAPPFLFPEPIAPPLAAAAESLAASKAASAGTATASACELVGAWQAVAAMAVTNTAIHHFAGLYIGALQRGGTLPVVRQLAM